MFARRVHPLHVQSFDETFDEEKKNDKKILILTCTCGHDIWMHWNDDPLPWLSKQIDYSCHLNDGTEQHLQQ